MTSEPAHYRIPAQLLAALLEYLSRRPYVEVAEAIAALRGLAPIPDNEEDPPS